MDDFFGFGLHTVFDLKDFSDILVMEIPPGVFHWAS